MPKRSIETEVILELADEIRSSWAEARETHPIPLMQERVGRQEAKSRFEKMTDSEKRSYIHQIGIPEAMKILGGRSA